MFIEFEIDFAYEDKCAVEVTEFGNYILNYLFF